MRKLVSVVSVAAMAMAVGASAQTPGYLSDETSGFVSEEQDAAIKSDWIEPAEPFKVLGNIHQVGSQNISSYLITTPEGHILVDTGMPQMHGLVRANIEMLGQQGVVGGRLIMLRDHGVVRIGPRVGVRDHRVMRATLVMLGQERLVGRYIVMFREQRIVRAALVMLRDERLVGTNVVMPG